MQRDLTCPKCAGRIFWQVRGMREHGPNGRIPELAPAYEVHPSLFDYQKMTWPRATVVRLGRLETLLCRACGYSTWKVLDFRGGEPTTGACAECASHRIGRLRMKTDSGGNDPIDMRVIWHGFPEYRWTGQFEARNCFDCGQLIWYALGLELTEGAPAVGGVREETDKHGCLECGQRGRWRIDTVRSQGDRSPPPLRVLLRDRLFYRREVGKFSLTVCRNCARAEWWARDFYELSPNARDGVTLLRTSERQTPDGGPYR